MAASQKPLLVTAFEPFGGWDANPGMAVLSRLRAPPGCRLVRAILPVDFARVARLAPELLDRVRPAAVLSLGLAANAACLRLERTATARWAEPGADPAEVRVQPGPAKRRTPLPVVRMARQLCKAGVPAVVSDDAGTYLCNFLYYLALAHASFARIPALFVHLPSTPEMAAAAVLAGRPACPSMETARMTKGVQALLDEMARRIES